MWTEDEAQAVYLKELGQRFYEEEGIRLSFTFKGRDVLTGIRGRLLMNDPPDLVDQDLSELNGAFMGGTEIMAESLTDLFYNEPGPEGQENLISLFDERIINLYRIDNEIYFFPYIFITSGFFYNQDLFHEKGYKIPVDWNEFMDLSFRLKIAGYSPLSLDGTIPLYSAYYFSWFLSRLINPDAFKLAMEDPTGETWNEPDYLMAARYVSSLSKRHYSFFQENYERSIFPLAQNQWAAKESAFILCGSWIPAETSRIREFNIGFFPFPNLDNRERRGEVEAYLIGCAVLEGAANSEGAREFIKFMITRENALFLSQQTGNISARTDIPYPEILADLKPWVSEASSFHTPYGGVLRTYPDWFSKVFYPLNNKLVFGEISPESFITEIQEKTIRYWKERNQ